MKIAFLEPLGIPEEELNAAVRAAVGAEVELVYYPDRRVDTETLVQRCEGADAVVLSNFPFRAEVMERCPALKFVCVAFTGVDHVDVDYCRTHGIAVSNRQPHSVFSAFLCKIVCTFKLRSTADSSYYISAFFKKNIRFLFGRVFDINRILSTL